MKKKSKDVVVGLGEIGRPIFKLLHKNRNVICYDVNEKLFDKKKIESLENTPTEFLHICIPFTKKFVSEVIKLSNKFSPKAIIIHSTIEPYTTSKIQNGIKIPIIYSATRGVHKRMLQDLKRYTKFFAIENNAPQKNWATLTYARIMKKCGVKTKKMSKPITLELAKIICDTSYYGWLISYSQISKMIVDKNNVNYDEMWLFADEIHEYLGNRPKMFPGFIGGHCVIPNLELINNDTLNIIKRFNTKYAKHLS